MKLQPLAQQLEMSKHITLSECWWLRLKTWIMKIEVPTSCNAQNTPGAVFISVTWQWQELKWVRALLTVQTTSQWPKEFQGTSKSEHNKLAWYFCHCSYKKEREDPLSATCSLHFVLTAILVDDRGLPLVDFLVHSLCSLCLDPLKLGVFINEYSDSRICGYPYFSTFQWVGLYPFY
jgi:hypothetical protein